MEVVSAAYSGTCFHSLFKINFYLLFLLEPLSVNIIGCFLIGFIFGLSERGNFTMEWRLFLVTGFLGGFTTFSSFSNETVALFRDGQIWHAFIYITSSLVVGLLATFTGISLIKFCKMENNPECKIAENFHWRI